VFHVSLLEPLISDEENRNPPALVRAASIGIVDARSVRTNGGTNAHTGAPILLSTHHKKTST
jgi:hypothetical protein